MGRQAFKAVKVPPGPQCMEQTSYSEIKPSPGKTVGAPTGLYLILTKHHHFQHHGVNWSIYTTFSAFMINLRIAEKVLLPDITQTPFMDSLQSLFHGQKK